MYARVIVVVGSLVVLCSALISAATINKRRVSYPFEHLDEKELYAASSQDLDYFNKLVLRLIDAAIEDAKERGTNDVMLDDMMRKRSGIRKCFFHAVNCW